MTEAAGALIRRGFEELGTEVIWCSYCDGNLKSKRVQEKLGFVYHITRTDVPVPLMHEVRVEHTNVLTKAHWEEIQMSKQRKDADEAADIAAVSTLLGLL